MLRSAGIGLVVGSGAALFSAWQIAVLLGWCAGALTFVGEIARVIVPADSATTHRIATREDDSRVASEVIILSASVASLIGVAFVLVKASQYHGLTKAGMTALGVLSVVLAWLTLHTVYTLRYAHLYFTHGGGIRFSGEGDPDYRDFLYVGFTIGMTYQVSDTDLTSKTFRRTALHHAQLSFVFGTVIIAMTINIVAGLAS